MALIICPECGKEISDKAAICVGCGFPVKEYLEEYNEKASDYATRTCEYCGSVDIDDDGYCNNCGMKLLQERVGAVEQQNENVLVEAKGLYTICPECDFRNEPGKFTCIKCGHKYTMSEYEVVYAKEETDFASRKCPSCNSKRVRAFVEEKVIIPKKTKGQTSINLNPFKPFTVFNQKEKVIRKEKKICTSRFICDACGRVFD
ncbi:MAG: zinc ribbon domain-containing protein [Lachnospiraceae bacterium]|nr:zinc ribbon domain-containing protein [Lachnospiraceae bacterium]